MLNKWSLCHWNFFDKFLPSDFILSFTIKKSFEKEIFGKYLIVILFFFIKSTSNTFSLIKSSPITKHIFPLYLPFVINWLHVLINLWKYALLHKKNYTNVFHYYILIKNIIIIKRIDKKKHMCPNKPQYCQSHIRRGRSRAISRRRQVPPSPCRQWA